MTVVKLTAVSAPREWTYEGKTNVDYILGVEGRGAQAILTQRPETPAPTVGQEIDLELTPHPRFPDKLKAKKPQKQFGGGGGFRPRDPAERKSIQMQASQKVAVDIARLALEHAEVKPGSEQITAQVKRIAGELFEQIEGVAK